MEMMTSYHAVRILNVFAKGWTTNGEIITNPYGGIIDRNFDGTWFIIVTTKRGTETLDAETLADAVAMYLEAASGKEIN